MASKYFLNYAHMNGIDLTKFERHKELKESQLSLHSLLGVNTNRIR
jgi:hypothetical protein